MPSILHFGELPAFPVGSAFFNRTDLRNSGVHTPPMSGISGNGAVGANSIVVSGGYEDDEDLGDVLIYTGQGGNDTSTKRQIADQQFNRGNLALARSCDEGLPVRVIRGAGGNPAHSPKSGFRYDGLFQVEQYWHTVGQSGYRIYLFRLVASQATIPDGANDPLLPPGNSQPTKRWLTALRIVRATAMAVAVKAMHHHECQVCKLTLLTPTGAYAEGAHIRPLGTPHGGPDEPENILCLCPNCHVRFDRGAIYVDANGDVIDALTGTLIGSLQKAGTHVPSPSHLDYHRSHWEQAKPTP